MLIEIQCLPCPLGTPEDGYAYVDAAIEIIVASGLAYEVGPLGTVVEGEPAELWPLVRMVHEACLNAGPRSLVSHIKIAQAALGEAEVTMDGLLKKHR